MAKRQMQKLGGKKQKPLDKAGKKLADQWNKRKGGR